MNPDHIKEYFNFSRGKEFQIVNKKRSKLPCLYYFMIRSALFKIVLFVLIISSCSKNEPESKFDCSIEEVPVQTLQHFNILFLGTNLTAENNLPRMVYKLAKSMGDSLFYLTMAPYDFDFKRQCSDKITKAILNDFDWDFVVMQESGWRMALPSSMTDSMTFIWADSLKKIIRVNNPSAQLIIFLTNGFLNGVKAIDANWAKTDPEVVTYKGMQKRINQNSFELASRLDAQLAPCGIIWNISMDYDSTRILHLKDHINPTIRGSYLSACTLYSKIYRKKLNGAFYPIEITEEDALFFQNIVSESLFECNPDWRYY
jgi:hypothetical protein